MVMTVLVTGVGCPRGQSHSEHPPLPRRRRSGPGSQPPLPVSESVYEVSTQPVNVLRVDCAVSPAASTVGGRRLLKLLALTLELDGRPGQETVLDTEDTGRLLGRALRNL